MENNLSHVFASIQDSKPRDPFYGYADDFLIKAVKEAQELQTKILEELHRRAIDAAKGGR